MAKEFGPPTAQMSKPEVPWMPFKSLLVPELTGLHERHLPPEQNAVARQSASTLQLVRQAVLDALHA